MKKNNVALMLLFSFAIFTLVIINIIKFIAHDYDSLIVINIVTAFISFNILLIFYAKNKKKHGYFQSVRPSFLADLLDRKFCFVSAIFIFSVYVSAFLMVEDASKMEKDRWDAFFNPFNIHINEFLHYENQDLTSTGYRKGKVLIIDQDAKKIDSDQLIFSKKYPGIFAKDPKQVGTVILLNYKRIKIGNYVDQKYRTDVGDAYQRFLEVTVIDKENHTKFAPSDIAGSLPIRLTEKSIFEEKVDRTGGNVEKSKLLDYILKLPKP